MEGRKASREKQIVALGFLTWGLSMLMRTSFGYYVDELSLTSTQVGIANAFLSGTVCLSTMIIGPVAERKGKFFSFLGGLLCICGASVLLLAYASVFSVILLSRVLLGVGCGPLFALIMKSVELSSTEAAYPRNAGVVSNGEACISTILGPVVIVFLLNSAGFTRTNIIFTFLLLILGAGWFAMNRFSGTSEIRREGGGDRSFRILLKNGRLMLCLLGGSLSLVAGWCIYMYVPTLLQKESGLPDTKMSWIMTAMGVFMAVWMIVLPSCYARVKDKGIIVGGCLLAALGLGGLAAIPGDWISIGLFVLFGGLASVMSLFFMAIISVEYVDRTRSASALALVNGGCELFGAALGPMAAGWLADRWGLRIGMVIPALCMLAAALVIAVIGIGNQKR